MKKIQISGGKPLNGSIDIGGSKNAALPIIFATILTADQCTLENLPSISDIDLSLAILEKMGAKVERTAPHTAVVDTSTIVCGTSPDDLTGRLRGATYLLGAELGRFGRTAMGQPGGCDFGSRPIDQHIAGFEAMGATMKIANSSIMGSTGPNGLRGAEITLEMPSVGATVNIILAAVTARGKTVIRNAAREPHIVDLVNFLNLCGASISNAGTDTIKINGVPKLHGVKYPIVSDMIEAGTYMVAVSATGGNLTLHNVIPKHVEATTLKLREMGVKVITSDTDNTVSISSSGRLKATDIHTNYYPGFPTDMHPQFSALLAISRGESTITECVWEKRFRYVEELAKFGAIITDSPKTVHITGQEKLHGAEVSSVDLRAGAAMVIAGLSADGTTVISNIGTIERGYENIIGKLSSVGADITFIDED